MRKVSFPAERSKGARGEGNLDYACAKPGFPSLAPDQVRGSPGMTPPRHGRAPSAAIRAAPSFRCYLNSIPALAATHSKMKTRTADDKLP
jgi:hypothetical protein